MYNTKQKQILIDFLKQNNSKQYSIKEISDSISNEKIGKSTVYRLIDKMIAEGSIKRFRGINGKSVLYQYVGENHECDKHFHLKCTNCGLLVHLECEYINGINQHITKHHNFNIDTSKTILYGICNGCSKKEI